MPVRTWNPLHTGSAAAAGDTVGTTVGSAVSARVRPLARGATGLVLFGVLGLGCAGCGAATASSAGVGTEVTTSTAPTPAAPTSAAPTTAAPAVTAAAAVIATAAGPRTPAAAISTPLPWPSATPAGATALQRAVDGGAQPWLLDPTTVAQAYAVARGWPNAQISGGATASPTRVGVASAAGRHQLTLAQTVRSGAGGIWLVTADSSA